MGGARVAHGAAPVGRGLVVFLFGVPYYLTPDGLRIEHDLHGLYGSGGIVGILLGFIGTVLMTVMLLYSSAQMGAFRRRDGEHAVLDAACT